MSKIEKTIKLWNYKKPSCELTKRFDSKLDGIDDLSSSDFLMSLSIHPFGYYLAVGFCDKLRIYHILAAELRNYKEIVLRGVCQLKFSNGGNFLAAAYSKQKYNIHLINVYNSYKMEEIARLSDHSNIITELCWKPDDKALYSVGVDGFVTEWRVDVRPENKEWGCRKWSQNNAKYTSVVFEKSSKSILVCGVESNKSVIREYRLEK
jgi:WD40 repeat protein